MIVKMEKYIFLIFHQEYKEFLYKLRSLGVVHIGETQNPKDVAALQETIEARKELKATMRAVKSFQDMENITESPVAKTEHSMEEGLESLKEAQYLLQRRNELEQEFAAKQREVNDMTNWGDFDMSTIQKLRDNGYIIDFFSTTKSNFKEDWEDKYNAVVINNVRSNVYFITINKQGEDYLKPEADLIRMPNKSLSEFEAELNGIENLQVENIKSLRHFANNRLWELEEYDKQLESNFDFSNALIQAESQASETVKVLQGWVPEESVETLEQTLEAGGYFFKKMEIEEGDKIPVKLKNNAFARFFEPITEMFSLPNYTEIDPTPLFAPFFLLFFGLCFGDAGYGLLLLIAATIGKIKSDSKGTKNVCTLLQYLGGGALVIGLMVGTVFGVTLPYARKESFILNQDNLMTLSIIIGLIQILFGKFIAALKVKKQQGLKYSLSRFAWVLVLIAAGAALILPVLIAGISPTVIYVCWGVAIAGLLVAFFYNSPGKNPLINVGAGLWNTYNMASGLLGDTLSYIRLFAIGLTSGILGSVFNSLAIDTTATAPWYIRFPLMLLILLIGHGLNMGLAIISSLVHPLRLTFVEFYKNNEFEGGGKPYSPFRIKK
ncbi:ATPase [Porphyromonas macacae]|uniref:ATPase n=2 Tax=Porphyromonas macacae TaxID=28115 RepID=A0A0A2EBR1_9PORP|nr:ATPase [Porphyromonas macacae]